MPRFYHTIIVLLLAVSTLGAADWQKHLITQQGHCNTAVALDANGDDFLDVIASFNGGVSLFWLQTGNVRSFFIDSKVATVVVSTVRLLTSMETAIWTGPVHSIAIRFGWKTLSQFDPERSMDTTTH